MKYERRRLATEKTERFVKGRETERDNGKPKRTGERENGRRRTRKKLNRNEWLKADCPVNP
jgi:hypothetical protein